VITFSSKGLEGNTAVDGREEVLITTIPIIYGIFLWHQYKGRKCIKNARVFMCQNYRVGCIDFKSNVNFKLN
jgi:hypothetical protein